MPIYEYECSFCGERSQRLQKVGEDSSGRACLSCGNGHLKKVLSTFGTVQGGSASCSIERPSRSR